MVDAARATRAVLLVVLAMVPSAAAQTQTPKLRDGEPFSVRGKLRIEYRGWHRYLVIALNQPYATDFGEGGTTKHLSALELNPQGQFDALAVHAGEVIEAQGTLQMDAVSPYYWNGVMLMASSTRLANGQLLLPTRQLHAVPAQTEQYLVTVTMVPHVFAWRREAVDLPSRQALPDADVDGCGLNGGGDVMNCFCVSGFLPVRAGVVPQALPPDRWRDVPSSQLNDPHMAQFELPDPEAQHPLTFQVVCKRKALIH